jgi:hypothetical protein
VAGYQKGADLVVHLDSGLHLSELAVGNFI